VPSLRGWSCAATPPPPGPARLTQLQHYCDREVLSGSVFVCSSASQCRASSAELPATTTFSAGQLSHVGHHYDLLAGPRRRRYPVRVVFLAMETGRGHTSVTLTARRAQVLHESGDVPVARRNPHMVGVTQALRTLYGLGLQDDPESEWLDLGGREPVHLFDTFALVNARLCSSTENNPKTGNPTSTSAATDVMNGNCSRHLRATLEVLEPSLMIVQGVKVWPLLTRYGVAHPGEMLTPTLYRSTVSGRPTLVATFVHPAARSANQNWGRLSTPYLTGTVVPTLQRAAAELSASTGRSDTAWGRRSVRVRQSALAVADAANARRADIINAARDRIRHR